MSNPITKKEMCRRIADSTELTLTAAESFYDAYHSEIISSVKNGNAVQIRGFGTFKPQLRAARTCRNPQTGDLIQVPQKTVPVFKSGKEFKTSVASA